MAKSRIPLRRSRADPSSRGSQKGMGEVQTVGLYDEEYLVMKFHCSAIKKKLAFFAYGPIESNSGAGDQHKPGHA